jgi:hypothetical protein
MSHPSEFDATTNRPNFFLSSEVVAAAEDEARKRGTADTDDTINHKKARNTESETAPSADPSSFGDSNGRNDMMVTESRETALSFLFVFLVLIKKASSFAANKNYLLPIGACRHSK